MAEMGFGTSRDLPLARAMYRKSVESGFAPAMVKVSDDYAQGPGTKARNAARAHRHEPPHLPSCYKVENQKRGITEETSARIPDWTPKKSLDVMDADGIQTAILSPSAPGVYFGNKREAIALA